MPEGATSHLNDTNYFFMVGIFV